MVFSVSIRWECDSVRNCILQRIQKRLPRFIRRRRVSGRGGVFWVGEASKRIEASISKIA